MAVKINYSATFAEKLAAIANDGQKGHRKRRGIFTCFIGSILPVRVIAICNDCAEVEIDGKNLDTAQKDLAGVYTLPFSVLFISSV